MNSKTRLRFLLDSGNLAYKNYLESGKTYAASRVIFKINSSISDCILKAIEEDAFSTVERDVIMRLYLHIEGWIEQYKYEEGKGEITSTDEFAWERWGSSLPFPDISPIQW